MDYRILGPLELLDGAGPLPLVGPRQRSLLALLIIHRNEVVSADRLIDGLWGDSPPPSAAKALQNAVSQVRRTLDNGNERGNGPLHTEPGGYRLRVERGELDADRFEALRSEARDATDAGDPRLAAECLREALALWRGPPLADVAYEAFAQPEIARLEEERLAALEERIDADLALGRHAELVAELEAEVARHPLRERLRGLLMLALYRSGRQADALEAYRDVRVKLDEELGLEPGPGLQELHEAILRQDPALATERRRRPPVRASRSHLPVMLAGAALLLLAAGAAAVAILTRGDGTPGQARLATAAGNSLVALDARTGRLVANYPTGSTPTSVTAGPDGAWALNADDRTLTRVAAGASSSRTFAVPDNPTDIAAGADGVWAVTGTRPPTGLGGIVPRRVLQLAPDTGAVVRQITLPRGEEPAWVALNRIAVRRAQLWAIGADGLVRIDPRSTATPVAVAGTTPSAVVASGDGAWAITETPRSFVLVRISGTGRITARVPIVATELDGLAAGAGAVWATAPQEGLLWRVSPGAARSIDVGAGARGVAVAGGGVWVANARAGTLVRVDPRSNRVTTVVRLGNAPRALAAHGARLWVTVAAASGAAARDAGRDAAGAVTASACGGVVTGAGTPQRLIVSNFPLQQPGLGYVPDAVAFVLRRHAFRAGRFRIGYQSCDDSTAQNGTTDPEKCRSNARLYAQAPRVVGIVGPWYSFCAELQLPITNRATGGPLATVSPTNTGLELTKPVPGSRPGALARLYPTGRRHYARLFGSDDGQATALARFAHDRGVRRLAIVDDGSDYGRGLAAYARRTARGLGMSVVSSRRLDELSSPSAGRAVARGVASRRPDGLLFAGVPGSGAAPLLGAARDRLGPSLAILLPDAWLSAPKLFDELGRSVRDVHVAAPGLPLQRLGPAGRRFVAEFGATQPGGVVTQDAVYVAQATEVLLDAIARSNGSRASVARALLATQIRGGLIGDVRFDADGDIRPRPFTIIRASPDAHTVNGVLPRGENLTAVVSP